MKIIILFSILLYSNLGFASIPYNCTLKAGSDLDPLEAIRRSQGAAEEPFLADGENLSARSVHSLKVIIEKYVDERGNEYLRIESVGLIQNFTTESYTLIKSWNSESYARLVEHRFGISGPHPAFATGLVTCKAIN